MTDLQESIAYLQKSTPNGHNLYNHLSDVLLKLLETKPNNAYDAFENISVDVKRSTLPVVVEHHNAPLVNENGELFESEENVKAAYTHVEMFKKEGENVDADDQGLSNEGEMANLLEESSALEWAGVGFTREDTYRIMLSMRVLLEQNPLKTVRLFGKVMGLQSDYYIVESEYKEGEGDILPGTPQEEKNEGDEDESDEDEDGEERGRKRINNNNTNNIATSQLPVVPSEEYAGTNKYTYWVCNNLGDEWGRLPNVTPSQIVAARKLCKYFTGDLEAAVKTSPPFPGKEKNYLRAQIGRIASSTSVCPKGYLVFEDEEDEANEEEVMLVADPEYAGHPPSALLDLSNWVHFHEYILPQGRCSYYRQPRTRSAEEEDEEYEEEPEEEDESESGPKMLTEISVDNPLNNAPSWVARLSTQFGRRHAIGYVRSLRWPGAYCVSWGARHTNIYVGYGVKAVDVFTPQLPPPPMSESSDLTEEIDPSMEEEREIQQQHEAQQPQKTEEEEAEEEGEEEDEGEEEAEDEDDYEDNA